MDAPSISKGQQLPVSSHTTLANIWPTNSKPYVLGKGLLSSSGVFDNIFKEGH